jgi:hypothetical protein
MIEHCKEVPRIKPLYSLKNEGAVCPANEASGNTPKIGTAQYEVGNLLHRTVIVRDEEKALLRAELVKQ